MFVVTRPTQRLEVPVTNNRIELVHDSQPQALLTWHLPDDKEHFYPIAFQFADGLDETARAEIISVAKRPLKLADKGYKSVQFGSSDHFAALPRPLARLGYRTRVFGVTQNKHVLEDQPIEQG